MQKEIATFFSEIENVYKKKTPFVVFSKPDENLLTAYVQRTNELHELNSFDDSGFVFAPFDPKEKTVFFPFNECDSFNTIINEVNFLEIDKIFIEKTQFINSTKWAYLEEKHIALVQKGIDFIKNKHAEKIVLSRKEILECPNLNVLNTFKKMLKAYKNAFVYLWYHPAVGLWLGATPERLLTVENGNFKTMALAGTQKYIGTTDVVWQKKEKQEQQYVTEFMLKNLNEFVESLKFTPPFTIQAGNLVHLRTDISGNLKSDNSLEKLISSLHPTPAVCGLPKTVAATFILQHEGYERAYYSGYLGELNKNNNSSLFVNLRCMQVENNLASLYVGGGITVDSNPENEWEETVSKAEVMKKVLS